MNENTNIKGWYKSTFPTDELGDEIKSDLTFYDLFRAMDNYNCVYETLEVHDSIVRERVFEGLAIVMGVNYQYIYEQWLQCHV